MGSRLLRKGLGIADVTALVALKEAAATAIEAESAIDVVEDEQVEAKFEAASEPREAPAIADEGVPRPPDSGDVFCRTCFGSVATGTRRVFSRC